MLTVADSPCVTVVTDAESFAALRQEWNGLLRESVADCPFLTWEWLHSWWAHLRGTSRLQILTVRAGSELLAVAPLRIARHLGVFPQLEFLGTGNAGSDYLDVIVRRGYEAECLPAIARCLEAQGLAAHLRNLPVPSTASALAAQLSSTGWTTTETRSAICPVIPLTGHTWESYLGTLSAAHRANVRRRVRMLQGQFGLRFEAVTSDAARRLALATLFTLHDERWGAHSTAFVTDALRAFHDDFTRLALEQGWLRLYVMTLNDTPAGVMYGFAYNRRFYFFQHAFDDQYQKYSAGLALMGLTIRAAIEEGLEEFDMLYGDESYKSHWASDHRSLTTLRCFPGHLAGTLHRQTVAAERSMRALVRRVIPDRLRQGYGAQAGGRRAA